MNALVTTQILIHASCTDVFRYLQNLDLHLLWNPHLQTISAQGNVHKGMVYETTSLVLGIKVHGTNKVTKFIKNQELEIKNDSGQLHYIVNYKLDEIDSNVQLRCTTDVFSNSKAFAFTKPVLRLLAQRELRSDLQALKIAVEQQLE